MVRGTWTTVLRDIDRLYVEGTSAGSSDEQLLSRFTAMRERSELAFESIVRRHGPMVLEVCRRILGGDHHAAEDAFQATFLVLARRAGSITVRPSGSLGPWLHEVACRTAWKARVACSRREAREQYAARKSEAVVFTIDQDRVDDDMYRVLHEEVSRLPPKYRAPIVLCYFEGRTHDQAAASLGWPVGTVRGYLSRARDLLRIRLIRRRSYIDCGNMPTRVTPGFCRDNAAGGANRCSARFHRPWISQVDRRCVYQHDHARAGDIAISTCDLRSVSSSARGGRCRMGRITRVARRWPRQVNHSRRKSRSHKSPTRLPHAWPLTSMAIPFPKERSPGWEQPALTMALPCDASCSLPTDGRFSHSVSTIDCASGTVSRGGSAKNLVAQDLFVQPFTRW